MNELYVPIGMPSVMTFGSPKRARLTQYLRAWIDRQDRQADMIVKFVFNEEYSRLVECDTVQISKTDESLAVAMYQGPKHVETPVFKDDPVDVFIMEHGKTIERIAFKHS